MIPFFLQVQKNLLFMCSNCLISYIQKILVESQPQVMLEQPPLVYIFNSLEDIIDAFRTLNSADKAQLQESETTWYNENQLLGILSQFPNRQSYHFVYLEEIEEQYIQYACNLLEINRKKIEILVPKKFGKESLGSICQYMLQDEDLMKKLKSLPAFDLLSFCMSDQLLQVYDTLKSNANPIQFTFKQDWQNIKRLGTKPGIRELVQRLKDPRVFMPNGRIFYRTQTSFDQAVSFIATKLRNQNVVVKSQRLFSGMGVLIFRPNQVQGFSQIDTECYIKDKMNKPFWKLFDLVVEEYIDIDFSTGPPCVQIKINKLGRVQVLWINSMLMENEKQFSGIECGKQTFRQDIMDKLKYIGKTLGEAYSCLGYRGNINIDCHIDKKGIVYVGESNVRRSASVFVHNFATYMQGDQYSKNCYLMTHIINSEKIKKISFESVLEEVIENGLEYTYSKGSGVILSSCQSFKSTRLEFFTITKTKKEALSIDKILRQIYQ